MDNAPGHGKLGDVELRNITIIRLPPNTTSVSQPLDAGIIMSFKVKYSRLMFPVVSRYRAELNSVKAKIPRAPLWACLPTAWDNVSRSCIQNCFASVPTIPAAMQETLKNAAKHQPDVELERLKGELAQIYPERVRSLGKQNDYGVLAFLKSMSRRGPTIYLDRFIDIVAADPLYKDHFLPNYDPAMAVGHDSCSDYSEDDDDYQASETVPQEDTPSQRTVSRRSGQYAVVIPEDLPSSQEVLSEEIVSSQERASQEGDVQVRNESSSEEFNREGPRSVLTKVSRHYFTLREKEWDSLSCMNQAILSRMEKRVRQDLEIMADIIKLQKQKKNKK
ncbi:hypothetical protein BGZ96_008173 [Linnemannia gamsii]|uniref:DDE-1 domain-containing protein n=1 Tax=Linnemannia gamsii TaxID=64522 RepID=A0ABQ7JZ56_9FUNG|nr:hypothetical protein BGZ96_008173 [Linnemannia gamsii]